MEELTKLKISFEINWPLQEKENDLELAAKIGQELLERNQRLEERVSVLEFQLTSSTDLITQLRHDLTVKTDLLHVYTNDAIEDSSPVEVSAFIKWNYIKVVFIASVINTVTVPLGARPLKIMNVVYTVVYRYIIDVVYWRRTKRKKIVQIEQNIFNVNIAYFIAITLKLDH